MPSLALYDRVIKSKLPAFVVGVVNVTPDSFYDKSRGNLERCLKLIEDGADILDIGAESTRPGSSYINEEEEIKRLVPLLNELKKVSSIPISVDTRKLSVFKEAFYSGADILNDISSLSDDQAMAEFCADKKTPVILMHKKGNPCDMQNFPQYQDCFNEVNDYLLERAAFAESKGIERDKIIIDPGFGFGKTLMDNVSLLSNCNKFSNGKYKVMIALSRKSFLGEITGQSVENRLAATLAANLIAVQNGASFLRVHDVKETVDTLKVLSYTLNKRE